MRAVDDSKRVKNFNCFLLFISKIINHFGLSRAHPPTPQFRGGGGAGIEGKVGDIVAEGQKGDFPCRLAGQIRRGKSGRSWSCCPFFPPDRGGGVGGEKPAQGSWLPGAPPPSVAGRGWGCKKNKIDKSDKKGMNGKQGSKK
jgi:hypothetical protein